MAAESNNALFKNWQLKQFFKYPHLRPKTDNKKTGEVKVTKFNNGTEKTYYKVKPEYQDNNQLIKPLIEYISNNMMTNNDILKKAEGGTIYTWILKRDNVHILPLRSNQEIGSLHAELDLLTTVYQNMGDNRVKPDAAGELVISNDKSEIYFNLQSGTYMAKKYESLEKSMMKNTSGISKKRKKTNMNLKAKMNNLKAKYTRSLLYGNETSQNNNCIISKLSKAIGIDREKIHFLDCSDQIDSKLREILPSDNFDHSPCRDDNSYNESIAGKNLIRRYNRITNPENRHKFNTFFTTEKPAPNPNNGPPLKAPKTNPLQQTLGGRRNTTRRKRKILRKRRI